MQGEQNAIDFLKDNLEAVNKRKYLQTVKHELFDTTDAKQQQQQQQQHQQQREKLQKISNEQEISAALEQYEETYLKFMYKDTLMTNSKSYWLIDECLDNVHSGLKTKKDCKYILSIMTKIYVQELIEESLEVLEEYKMANLQQKKAGYNHNDSILSPSKPKRPQKIDVDVIQQAYRRRLIKKQQL